MKQWLALVAGAAVLVVFELPRLSGGAVVAALLASAVLVLALSRSNASGPGSIVILTGLLFVTSWLVNIPEGVLFDVIEPAAAPVGLVKALLASFAAVLVIVAVAGRSGPGRAGDSAPGPDLPATATLAVATSPSPIRSVRGLLWRLAATPAVFVACYFVAGMIIYPIVRDYYVGRAMPDPLAIASMQVLRSLALLAAAYSLLRTLERRRDAVLVLGLALPVFGAVFPMLPANDLMPAGVRLVHALETVPSTHSSASCSRSGSVRPR